MLTILSALGGFATSLLPDVVGQYFKAKQAKLDYAHELAMVREQRAAAAAQHGYRVEEANLQADVAESAALHKRVNVVGVRWVDALNASVRPVVTYAFFALFASTVIATFFDAHVPESVWNENVQALFGGIMGYWFGNRSMKHARERV